MDKGRSPPSPHRTADTPTLHWHQHCGHSRAFSHPRRQKHVLVLLLLNCWEVSPGTQSLTKPSSRAAAGTACTTAPIQFHPWMYGGWCGSSPCVQPKVSPGPSTSTLRWIRWDRSRTALRPPQDGGLRTPTHHPIPLPPARQHSNLLLSAGNRQIAGENYIQPLPNPTDFVISRQLGAITSTSCYTLFCLQHMWGWGRRAASHPIPITPPSHPIPCHPTPISPHPIPSQSIPTHLTPSHRPAPQNPTGKTQRLNGRGGRGGDVNRSTQRKSSSALVF